MISTFVQETKRKVKVYLTGLINVQSAHQVSPYGVDSNPIADMKAIYGQTEVNGRPVIIGYINKNVLADEGEIRLFSTDSAGALKMYVWLTNDGLLELGGDSHNLVRYTPLNSGLQDLKTAINAELTKIQTAISGLGGAYSKSDVSVDISSSKIEEIKTL